MWSAHNPKSDMRAHACVHMNISDVSKWNGSRQCKGKPFPLSDNPPARKLLQMEAV